MSLLKRMVQFSIGFFILRFSIAGGLAAYSHVFAQETQAKSMAQSVLVERLSVPLTVSANGMVEPEQWVNISPKTAGVLKELRVKEGERVSGGQVIAVMDDSNLQGQLLQAQGQLAAAQANLQRLLAGNRPEEIAQAEARLSSVQATLVQAESDRQRSQNLFNQGAIARQMLDESQTTYDRAQAQVLEAQQALAVAQQGARSEEIAQAQAQVTAAEGTVKTIQASLNDMVVRAPFSGTITRKFADLGAFITPTALRVTDDSSFATPSAIVSLAGRNHIVANVAEADIAQIQVGQTVVLQADAYPEQTFPGRVTQIAPQSKIVQNVTSFEVMIEIMEDSDQLLRSGMSVDVMVEVGELTDVLAVPTVAIVQQIEGMGVYVAGMDQTPMFVPIVTGATVDTKTEVVSGLMGNERVLLSLPGENERDIGFDFWGGFR
ncbi:MAG: efflux RND transporter periplasmic adaptor subunit [Elainellaceae cyanobacterium]